MCFDREFEFDVFAMGKWLRIACFPTSVLLIINVFPHFSRKKESSNFSPRVTNLPFQYVFESDVQKWKRLKNSRIFLYKVVIEPRPYLHDVGVRRSS